MCLSFPVRTLNSQLAAEQRSIWKCWNPPKKILHIQGQRSSLTKMVGGAQLCLKSNLIPARDVAGHKQKLVCCRTQERGAVTPQETEPHLPMSVLSSLVKAWVDGGLLCDQEHWQLQHWGTQCAGRKCFGGGCHYPYHSLGSGQTTEKGHSPIHQQKIGWKIHWAWPCPSKQDWIFLIGSPSHQEVAHASYSHASEGRQKESHSLRKLTKMITWITALCISMKLRVMLCGVSQDG